MNTPKYIVLHHTAVSLNKYAEQLTIVEKYHERKYGNTAYHYFVGGDGTVVNTLDEKKPGAHTWCTKVDKFPNCEGNPNWMDENSIGIVLTGNFSDTRKEYPTKAQFKAFTVQLLALQRKYRIDDDHVILHADASQTACPGIDLHPRNWKTLESFLTK